MDWIRVADLLGGRPLLCPLSAFVWQRLPHDIFYSPRAGRKLFSSNGLASGMTLEEAVLHAICEAVERHATVIAEVSRCNPGDGRPFPHRFVDLRTAPPSVRRLARLVERGGFRLEILDLTSEVRVPTFQAVAMEERPAVLSFFGSDLRRDKGTACHPDPEVALGMAILEACQTLVGNIAGAREDLTLKVRSMGRHERTGAETRAAATLLCTGEGPTSRFDEIPGFVSRDALADVRWTLDRIADAGFRHVLVADLTRPEMAPACVVRALIPGLETLDPFCTGPRARVALLRDLFPTRPAGRGGGRSKPHGR
jgi:ribosomal protein S12 methylthiotransferase accessory factor